MPEITDEHVKAIATGIKSLLQDSGIPLKAVSVNAIIQSDGNDTLHLRLWGNPPFSHLNVDLNNKVVHYQGWPDLSPGASEAVSAKTPGCQCHPTEN